jgi:hypothetical protein
MMVTVVTVGRCRRLVRGVADARNRRHRERAAGEDHQDSDDGNHGHRDRSEISTSDQGHNARLFGVLRRMTPPGGTKPAGRGSY